MFIKTPDWMRSSHIFRKEFINPTMMSKAIKEFSHIETEKRTKKKLYSAGKSTSLSNNFYKGSTLTNKEVDTLVKTYFPEQGMAEKVVEMAEKVTDFLFPSDGTLLQNSSDSTISISMDCVIKNPKKETKLELLGLEQLPVVKGLGIKHKVNMFNKRKIEENLYPNSSKILKVENVQEPIQAEWRKSEEDKGAKFLINKDKHILFDGESVKEGNFSGKKSMWQSVIIQ